MNKTSGTSKDAADKLVKNIRRKTRQTYSAEEKIRTVAGSPLPTKQTLDMLGIARTTFYRWYDLYLDGGVDALDDLSPQPKAVWNRIPPRPARRFD